MDKFQEMFGDSLTTSEYKTDENGQVISLGKDSDGNDIKVSYDYKKSDIMDIDPEILAKLQDPVEQARRKAEQQRKHREILDNYFQNTKIDSEYYDPNRKPLFQIPESFIHMLHNEEDDIKDLDNRQRKLVKDFRKEGSYLKPSMLQEMKSSIDAAMNHKASPAVRDFLIWAKENKVDFDRLEGNDDAIKSVYEDWKKTRRPAVPNILQRLLDDTDKKFFEMLELQPQADNMTIKRLRIDMETRLDFIREMEEIHGGPIFTMDDFIIQKFHFQEYGFSEDDAKWFIPTTPIPSRPGITMGDYLNEFKARTGYNYMDVYHYWWDKVKEEKELEMQKEAVNAESYDQIKPDSQKKVVDTPKVKLNVVYDDEDLD